MIERLQRLIRRPANARTAPAAAPALSARALLKQLQQQFPAFRDCLPLAIGIALFISHYAPRRIATPVAYLIDLLAAVPSVVYGLWGGRELARHVKSVSHIFSHT